MSWQSHFQDLVHLLSQPQLASALFGISRGLIVKGNPRLSLDRVRRVVVEHRSVLDELRLVREHSPVEYDVLLRAYAHSRRRPPFAFPQADAPLVSLLIPVYNQFDHTYRCLASILDHPPSVPYEVIIADDGSSDRTQQLGEIASGITVVRNRTNLGFLRNCNHAMSRVRGKYVLFLNNDTLMLPGALTALVQTAQRDATIGVVGGRLIFPTGRLQEAGSIVWQDGSCLGYGRGDDPFLPEYSYVREVDYCSGACLLTPTELFLRAGLFDTRYAPAYYEETDYCMRIRSLGYRVVYQPSASIIHCEFASGSSESGIAQQARNRTVFTRQWATELSCQQPSSPSAILRARQRSGDPQHPGRATRLLVMDDMIPDSRMGRGLPRAFDILCQLAELGYQVTYFPILDQARVPQALHALQQRGVEVWYRRFWEMPSLAEFLDRRAGYYDAIFVSRPHNMKAVKETLLRHAKGVPIIYDAEAIFAQREILFAEVSGHPLSPDKQAGLIQAEIAITEGSAAMVTVSPQEKQLLARHGCTNLHVLGHVLDAIPTPNSFAAREGILFVGGVNSSAPNNPNYDAILHFAKNIFPQVRQSLPCLLYLVGHSDQPDILALRSQHIQVVGEVDDLAGYFNRCRVFVVPTRFAAGIPHKLHHAAAHGLPAVVTPLIAEQVGWEDGVDVLSGTTPSQFAQQIVRLYSDPALWESVRSHALARIAADCDRNSFRATLRTIVESAVSR